MVGGIGPLRKKERRKEEESVREGKRACMNKGHHEKANKKHKQKGEQVDMQSVRYTYHFERERWNQGGPTRKKQKENRHERSQQRK
jgi:hypothetical protein